MRRSNWVKESNAKSSIFCSMVAEAAWFPLSVAVFPSLSRKRAQATADKMLTIHDLHCHSSVLRNEWVQIKAYDFWIRSVSDGTEIQLKNRFQNNTACNEIPRSRLTHVSSQNISFFQDSMQVQYYIHLYTVYTYLELPLQHTTHVHLQIMFVCHTLAQQPHWVPWPGGKPSLAWESIWSHFCWRCNFRGWYYISYYLVFTCIYTFGQFVFTVTTQQNRWQSRFTWYELPASSKING